MLVHQDSNETAAGSAALQSLESFSLHHLSLLCLVNWVSFLVILSCLEKISNHKFRFKRIFETNHFEGKTSYLSVN